MKRVLCLLFAALLLIGCCPIVSLASDEGESEVEFEPALTYQDVNFEVERPSAAYSLPTASALWGISAMSNDTAVPSSYSSVTQGKVTSAKNQGSYGTCWAFSATSVGESSYIVNDGVKSDLSDLQLAYFFYLPKIDPLGNATGDSNNCLDSTILQRGGNHVFTMWALANWTNATTESILPYSTANCNAAQNGTLSEEYANKYDVAHLQNAYIIPYSTASSDMNNIKQAIMEYGSVACSYYHKSDFYNSTYGSYYTTTTGSNHAVSIVGWNDSFSKSNFNSTTGGSSSSSCFGNTNDSGKPSGNGAWLVKNSWGSSWGTDGDANASNSGAEGYFWLSYYDASIASVGKVFVYDFTSADTYKYNYQYDGACGTSTASVPAGNKIAAVYTVKGLTAAAEKLEAVGFGVSSTNETGKVYIYADPEAGKPESGKLVAEKAFSTYYAGYYTVPLDEAVTFKKGQDYSIVIAFDTAATIYADSSYQNGDWISFTANTQNDRTYKISGSTVTSFASSGKTARIKGYTNDAEVPAVTYKVEFNANGGTNAPAAQIKTEGVDLVLTTDEPTLEGYNFLGWSENADASYPDYTAGSLYTIDKDTLFYAIWERKTASSLTLSKYSMSLTEEGSSDTVTVYVDPSDAEYNFLIIGAEKVGNVYTIDGLELTQSGDTFTVKALTFVKDNVSVTFLDGVSQKYVTLTVTVKAKPIVAQSITVDPASISLTVGDNAKTVTLRSSPANAECTWAIKNATKNGSVYTLNGLKITQNGSSFAIEAAAYTADKVNVTFYDAVSGKEAVCVVSVSRKIANAIEVSAPTLDLIVGGDAKTFTVSSDPADAEVDYYIKNASKSGSTYTIDGLTITKDGNAFTVKATSLVADTVYITVVDSISGKEDTCTVGVSFKKATSIKLSDAALSLTVGDGAKTLTLSATPSDAVCEFTIKNAAKVGSTYTIDGLTITQNGNSFSVKADSKVADKVTLTFVDARTGLEADCTITVSEKVTKSMDVSASVTSSKQRFLLIFTTTTYKATITATPTGTTVKKVEYSTNSGKKWTSGTSFTSSSNITSFMIRVTDSDGDVYLYQYSNGKVTAK